MGNFAFLHCIKRGSSPFEPQAACSRSKKPLIKSLEESEPESYDFGDDAVVVGIAGALSYMQLIVLSCFSIKSILPPCSWTRSHGKLSMQRVLKRSSC